jgi:hypothetical protein
VKSWDIGFALIDVARDIFWELLKGRINYFDDKVDPSTPASFVKIAFNNDPLANQNTMWIITSSLTVMVPMLSAHLILGASGMYDMFKYSIDQTANRFATFEGKAARRHKANQYEKAQRKLEGAFHTYSFDQELQNQVHEGVTGNKMAFNRISSVNHGAGGASSKEGGGADTPGRSKGPVVGMGDGALQDAAAKVGLSKHKYTHDNMRGDNSRKHEADAVGAANHQRSERGTAFDKNGKLIPGKEADAQFTMAHGFRGMSDPESTMSATIEGQNVGEREDFKILFADATDEQRQRAIEGKMSHEEFGSIYRNQMTSLADGLATVTTRKQYVIMEGGAGANAAMDQVLRRQNIARTSRPPIAALEAQHGAIANEMTQARGGSGFDNQGVGNSFDPFAGGPKGGTMADKISSGSGETEEVDNDSD